MDIFPIVPGEYVYPTVALSVGIAPWRPRKDRPMWFCTGIDCFGHLSHPVRLIIRPPAFKFPIIAPPYVYHSGIFGDSRFLAWYGLDVTGGDDSYKTAPPDSLPNDIIIDMRTVEHYKNQCCPPQLEFLMFEGIEMI